MKTITRSEYLQLLGLHALAKRHVEQLNDIERAACAITGQIPLAGTHTSDAIWNANDDTVDALLERLEITVLGEGNEAAEHAKSERRKGS
jgi:hypothetical protein